MKNAFLVLMLALGAAAQASPASDEWHEYCEMTVHIKVDGWYLEKGEQVVTLPVNPSLLKCKTQVTHDFVGGVHTEVQAILALPDAPKLMTLALRDPAQAYVASLDGVVPADVACRPVQDLLSRAAANGGKLQAKVRRELVRQDWASPKNVDVRLIEQLQILFSEGSQPFAASAMTSTRGKFCSIKPN